MIFQYIMGDFTDEFGLPLKVGELGMFCGCDNPDPYYDEDVHELLCDSCGGLIEDSESFV